MDGTMIDNMMAHHHAWQQKLAELGMEMSIEEIHQKVHGINVEILKQLFGNRFTPDDRQRISDEKEAEYRRIFEPDLALLNGLPELLHELKGKNIPMGVGSAAPSTNVDFVMNKLNLWHYFDAVMHSEHVENGKPHPEIYLKVSEALGLKPKDCLVFEDTPTGVQSALSAGSKVIVVTTTHQKAEFPEHDNLLKFISDFTKISLSELLTY